MMADDEREEGTVHLSIGGDVTGPVAAGENVVQIGTVSGGEVVVTRPGEGEELSPEEMVAIPAELYRQLRTTLLQCGPFADEGSLAALFVTEPLSRWRHDVPHANSAGDRVEKVIAWLLPKGRGAENGLVRLLQTLSGRLDPDDSCRPELEAVAAKLAKQTS